MDGKVFLMAVCLVGGVSAWWPFDVDPDWDGLRVTFGLNLLKSFNKIPRTMQDAIDHDWVQLDGNCGNNSQFLGHRYIKDDDRAVITLYDVKGYIAGIQTSFLANVNGQTYPPQKQRGNIFQLESDSTTNNDYYTLTAYFVNPDNICHGGRTEKEFQEGGTGSDLYIQMGSDPVNDVMKIPKLQSDVGKTAWSKGQCFPLMGLHYWYNVSEDMSCNDFQPVFLLYTGGKLNAFGWAMGVDLTSPRYEHPPHKVISKFMTPVPKCLYNYPRLSTMHIYLKDSYITSYMCPLSSLFG
ncbi:hypothetical protein ACOMHN_034354 [Nucella lapillus]